MFWLWGKLETRNEREIAQAFHNGGREHLSRLSQWKKKKYRNKTMFNPENRTTYYM